MIGCWANGITIRIWINCNYLIYDSVAYFMHFIKLSYATEILSQNEF